MNKQEILNEINKTKEHLANMEKMLEECEQERWKPKEGEEFLFIDAWSRVCYKNYTDNICCREYHRTYNCFQTEEEAKQEVEKILIRRQLEDIVRRLNKGQKIDWNNGQQKKYFFYYDNRNEVFVNDSSYYNSLNLIYCLDENFLSIAIREIGEERLKKYLRGE